MTWKQEQELTHEKMELHMDYANKPDSYAEVVYLPKKRYDKIIGLLSQIKEHKTNSDSVETIAEQIENTLRV